MSKPIVSRVHPFDSTWPILEQGSLITTPAGESVSVIFNYIYQGTFQQFQNEIRIYNSQGALVYQRKYDNMRHQYLLPIYAILNGDTYTAQIRVFGKLENNSQQVSDWSDIVQFKTFARPIFEINNIHQDQQIANSNFTVSVFYSQAQGEMLKDFSIYLYDKGMQLIHNSGRLSPSGGMLYTITSLLDNEGYYIKANGETVSGMIIETGLIRFSVEYINPPQYILFELTNHPDDGAVGIRSNIIIIDGISNPSPPIYIDNNEVDLTDPTYWVRWEKGFSFKDSFLMQIDMRSTFGSGKTFFQMWDDNNNSIYLQRWEGVYPPLPTIRNFIRLYSDNNVVRYVTCSNVITRLNTLKSRVTVKKDKYLYEVKYSRR